MSNQGDARRAAEDAYSRAKNNPKVSKEDKETLKSSLDAARAREETAKKKSTSVW